MASGSALIALLDDIAAMVKITSEKTSSVFNARGSKSNTDYDISAVLTIAKGSAKNKAIVIPIALAVNAIAPWAIVPLLAVGGAYFCYEGVKKINYKQKAKDKINSTTQDPKKQKEFLKQKIKQALKTDMVISAEIIALTMLTIATAPFITQLGLLTAVGAATTVGVYSIVAGIVNMGAFGQRLKNKTGKSVIAKSIRSLGKGIVKMKPKLMQAISAIGTVAMFLVGGALILHGIPPIETAISGFAKTVASTALMQSIVQVGAVLTGALATGFAATVMKNGCVISYKKALAIGKKKLPLFFNRKLSKQMQIAVEVGDTMGAKKLLKQGASLNITNWNGETPLMRATWFGRKELVQAFLKAGANPNKKSNTGGTALKYAINNQRPEIEKILIKHGAKSNK